jgi:hypothetical protein
MAFREKLINNCLVNWGSLNKILKKLNEAECEAALLSELEHEKRKQFVIRIHARFSTLRMRRERDNMLQGLGYETSNSGLRNRSDKG